jgi:hypothetical protein
MNKSLKLALLPAAVASAMFANNAFAGTEACFEITKSVDNALGGAGAASLHSTLYTQAACTQGVGAGSATEIAAQNPSTVAWELTRDLSLDGEAVNATQTLNIVYIPTTDIPPASRIQMTLDGATWDAANNSQIYLMKAEWDGTNVKYDSVASTDGAVTGQNTITFVTKAGVTIGAGTRLLLSLESTMADDTEAAAVSPVVRIQNDGCAPSPAQVTLAATSVLTDASQPIEGGVSSPFAIADLSSQFGLATGSDATNDVEVNAEAPSYRINYVYSKNGSNEWEGKVTDESFFWETNFTNDQSLDQRVVIDSNDRVEFKLYSTAAAGASVQFDAYQHDTTAATSPLDVATADHLSGNAQVIPMYVNGAGTTVNFSNLTADASNLYAFEADDVLADANATTKVAYRIYNSDAGANGTPMNFNYSVTSDFGLQLDTAGELSKDFCDTPQTVANVGVNGAVLKVPYTYATWARGEGVKENWVRLTNEHTSDAEVTVEVFAQSAFEGTAGTQSKVFTLGNIGPQDSAIYYAEDIANLYDAEVAGDNGNRFTFTFTVTAPKNSVHGVAVNKVGEADRVLPVLDQNDWRQ